MLIGPTIIPCALSIVEGLRTVSGGYQEKFGETRQQVDRNSITTLKPEEPSRC
jgi:hypothetical protein